jgi:hypothetical protein
VGLLAWLLLILSGLKPGRGPYWKSGSRVPGPGTASLIGLILLAGLGLLPIPDARADFPDAKLLEGLRERLLAPPECLPACAEIPLLRLKLNASELEQRLEIHAGEAVAVPLPAQEGQWLPSRVSVDGAPAEELMRTASGGLWLGLKPGRHEVLLLGPLPQREQVQLPLPLKPRRVQWEGIGWRVDGVGEAGVPEAQLQLSRELASPVEGKTSLEPRPLPPFLELRRILQFGLDWRVTTEVRRGSPADAPVVAEIPLLEGESVTTPGIVARNGQVAVNLPAGQESLRWESILERRPELTLTAPVTTVWMEVWQVDVGPVWHLRSEGIPVAHHQDMNGNWLPEWRPWPGETVRLFLERPQAVPGNSLTLESSRLEVTPGIRAQDVALSLSILSSQGGQHPVKLPEGAVLQSVSTDGKTQPIRQQDRVVTLPIHPGSQSLVLNWRQGEGIAPRYVVPEVNVGVAGVNGISALSLGKDRWVLLAGGPRLGPAVLFWGVLVVILLLSAGLGRIGGTPLKARHWALLLVGLSQISLFGGFCVVAWLFALDWRGRHGEFLDDSRFNALQLGLALLSLIALGFLFAAVEQGLLGVPDMQVSGNGSDAHHLNWYQDHSSEVLPRPWVISIPLWTYRLLMLSWALWLAYALLRWLGWGWHCYAHSGLWRPRARKAPSSDKPDQGGNPPVPDSASQE